MPIRCTIPIILALCMPLTHVQAVEVKAAWNLNQRDPHEDTHEANSRIRNAYCKKHGGRWNAAYVLGNKAFVMPEPPFRLGHVARAIPQAWRGQSYNLYMIQQARDWDDSPLYVMDEFSAYLNGLETDLNVTNPHSGIGFQYDVCLEFYGYAYVLQWLARQYPQYDSSHLDEAFEYQGRRLDALGKRVKTRIDSAVGRR